MPVNTFMPKSLIPHYDKELKSYRDRMAQGALKSAWQHLERAHVIGQKYPYTHSLVHWKMLLFGFKIKSTKEIVGQIPRLLIGGIKSFVGKIPIGNTGGANVPPLQPLPIQEDIQKIFREAGLA